MQHIYSPIKPMLPCEAKAKAEAKNEGQVCFAP